MAHLVCHIEVDLVARHCSLHIVEVGVVSIGNSEVEEAVGSYKQLAAEVVRILEVGSSSAGAGTAVVALRILQGNPMVDNQT
jgi:4-hydroxy-3-methylbut-2-en-1-yl diphosphate synthase IspG/GcpE